MDAKKTEVSSKILLRDTLASSVIAIVDSSTSARVGLATLLVRLGAVRSNMLLIGTVEEAEELFREQKPKIVFCDYMIGKRAGLDLLQSQKAAYGHEPERLRECVFVLVTANGSQSAVAQAAEEDVDTYILKPYSFDGLRKALEHAVQTKLRPGPYLQAIERGKDLLMEGKAPEAIACFDEAMKLDPKPTLACFYMGQAELMRELAAAAGDRYRQGLDFNKIHYKCLVGLYEILYREGRHADAYEIVKRIAKYFPANRKRLAAVLRLAILTSQYDDIEGYYRLFTALDERTDELTRYICSALSVTGKHYLQRGYLARAMEVFDRVAVSGAGRTVFLRYLIEALAEAKQGQAASVFLDRFPADTRSQEDFLVSELLVKGATEPAIQVVGHGLNLVSSGIENASVYRIIVQHASEAGLWDKAENFAYAAMGKWPEKRDEFQYLLSEMERKRGSSLLTTAIQ